MATPSPILQLKRATLALGHQTLAENADLALARGEHACLVGRNGSGKSTLLRALAGELDLDGGERFVQPGARVAYLPQDPDLPDGRSVSEHVAAGLPEDRADEQHRVDAVLARLDLPAERDVGHLSGGEGRRVALARALVADPDVLLLDEPTNHLDLPTIAWLEGELKRFEGALVLVSHDRAFLRAVTGITFWLDRARLRRLDKGFAHFDDWAEEVAAEERRQLESLERRIKQEELWMHQGISGRRRRNMGRVRKLEALRASRAQMLTNQPGSLKIDAAQADDSGQTVIEARDVAKRFTREDGETVTVADGFSTRIRKGDRIGIVGPNGAGKTSLIRLLTGETAPDSGTVRHGTNLQPIYFDQRRTQLDPNATLWETLAPKGGDSVTVGGKQRHVVAYLRDFLFEDEQARQPVRALSGGETNRLLLAKLFARPSNLIIMDEPTNDLDMETLDLLGDVLADYDGTLLIVSHDRDFLDQTVTSIVTVEHGGRVEEYPGGYSDAVRQHGELLGGSTLGRKTKAEKKAKGGGGNRARERPDKLSYKEKRELDELPGKIERLQTKVAELEEQLADPDFAQNQPDKFQEASDALRRAQDALDKAETRWLELAERQEQLQAGA
ncbi:ATP-binding cassette, subfamily F, uup [Limimonas halophila]|uniref:ATP-binding protein Uup n=1 Tax=Limimonas halophila TaxID=1082479 RepID=A0A1G7U6L8_9PROT|nr:ATP-binding cassette domain-containing protein [Limimonas halophila]SDG43067.1 ATP-binding cassette, subfamily F, uup [Limimonas halophila]